MGDYLKKLDIIHLPEPTAKERETIRDGREWHSDLGYKPGRKYQLMIKRQYVLKTIDDLQYEVTEEQYIEIREKMVSGDLRAVFIMKFPENDHDEQIIPIRCIVTMGIGTLTTYEELPKTGYEEGGEI